MKRLIGTDWDGSRYYQTEDDRIVDERGQEYGIEEEANIRAAFLGQPASLTYRS